jgi:hypothetical protein
MNKFFKLPITILLIFVALAFPTQASSNCTLDSAYGLNLDLKAPRGQASVADLDELGVCVVRVELHKDYDFSPFLNNYKNGNIKVLAILDYALVTGNTYELNSTNPAVAEAFLQRYIAEVNKQIDLYGQYIDAYEIWNEADLILTGSYRPYVNPKMYARMAEETRKIIDAKDPSAQTVLGSLAAGNPSYLSEVKNNLPEKDFRNYEGVSIHPYARSTLGYPSASWGVGKLNDLLFKYISLTGSTPIWITEFGYQSTSIAEEIKQSKYIEYFYREVEQSIYVKNAFLFAYSDDMVANFGLRAKTSNASGLGRKKASWTSYKSISREFEGNQVGTTLYPAVSNIAVVTAPNSINTVAKITSSIPVVVTEQLRDNYGFNWAKIKFTQGGKNYEGWVERWRFTNNLFAAKYAVATSSSGTVRSGAGTKNAKITVTNPSVPTQILATTKLSNGETWYNIKFTDKAGKEIVGWSISWLFKTY